ncbi:Uma2 family endonuclease [Actinocorallia lasiicapitis]
MTADPLPDWAIPPEGGFTVEDFLKLRDLPRHTELIDGSLVFVSPQRQWHSSMVTLLELRLGELAPPGWTAIREMSVKLGRKQMPEPDVAIITETAFGEDRTYYLPEDLLLAVEVISPDSEERDRDVKPRRYAGAGIPHYWTVERVGTRPVVKTFERSSAEGGYVLTGIHHDQLTVDSPFKIDIDLKRAGSRFRDRP